LPIAKNKKTEKHKTYMMIFVKYETKNKIFCSKKKNLVTKFFQKPVRNTNLFLSIVTTMSSASILENKVNFNNSNFNYSSLNFMVLLNKKIIV
jgi:hypothetical protein